MDEVELGSAFDASLAGNKDAFGRIVSKYQGLVCSITYGITGSVETSEDLAQESLIAAWQKLRDLRDRSKLPSWLCGIARNLALSYRRKHSRDPLNHAEEISEQHAMSSEDSFERISRAEREGLIWHTLQTIPEEYREPLILFYREGQSVRTVASALDISEDCARQRLSRGRKMLKEQVARLVEDSLRETRPGNAFTFAVLAALPVAAAQSAVAGGIGSTAVVTGKSATGATVTAGISAGMLGGLVGALIGMTGGFFGMWRSILNSPTLRARRYMLKCCCLTYAFLWLFLGFEAMSGVLSWRTPAVMIALASAGWALYIPLLFVLIVRTNRAWLKIVEEDLGRRLAPSRPLEQTSLSRRSLQMCLSWTFPLATLGSGGTVLWIHSMPWSRSLWLAVAGLVFITHGLFVVIFRQGFRMAYDEAAFTAHPPTISAEDQLALRSGKKVTHGPSARSLFYNDLAAMAGGIFGPMAPLIAMSCQEKDFLTAFIIWAVSLAVLVAGMTSRKRTQRRGSFFGVCIIMGVFSMAIMSLKWADWTEAGVLRLPEYFGLWSGAIPLALYWCIGFASLYTMPSSKERQ